MEFIFELLAQFAIEFLLQVVFELGGRSVVAAVRKETEPADPWLVICGYVAMGAVAGGISIWLVPIHLIKSSALQLFNLALAPILLGFAVEAFGRWKTKKNKPRFVVDRFSYGFTFALTMGLVRYFFAA